ncbi:hypothetical protein JKP88DRAFT_311022 [Tribonema minus]|uniref:Uncharacterized protein n=1 Tax=Tribonema minus TaxID=303371 RepID=A0A835Z560_9STRA|nr:hypothetical protein JKP88DRAFT_311022 [Tribonema minus]
MEDIITGDLPDVPALTPEAAAAYCKDVIGAEAAKDAANEKAYGILVSYKDFKGQTDLNLQNTPFYDGPIDDMLTFVYMDNSLTLDAASGAATLMYSGVVFRRTAEQDTLYKRPFVSILGINAHPEVAEYLIQGGAVKRTFMHEMLHSVGIGTSWPSPAGCGNKELCMATVLKEAGTKVHEPIPYTPAGAPALCKADAIYREKCAASEWCTARNGDMPLLVESEIPATKEAPNFGSNCGHWPESQLPAEIISTMAEGKKLLAGPRLFLTAVTIGALEDLGFQVNYDSKEIDDFDLINSRLRELDQV